MKKTMLWGALCMLISSQILAETANLLSQEQAVNIATATTPTSATTPNINNTPTAQTPAATSVLINCEYKIPANTKQVDKDVVIAWTEKAIIQAFDFDSSIIDAQMQKLQSCFTDQGWQGFNNALQKSGNIEAIKTQKLTVSSQLDGKVELLEAKDNQWKIAVPLQVVYQNNKEKVTQLLHLNVTIGRKISGDLGIMQMVATPRTETSTNQAEPGAATPSQPNTASIPVQPSNDTAPTQTIQSNQPTAPGNLPVQQPVNNGPNQANPGPAH